MREKNWSDTCPIRLPYGHRTNTPNPFARWSGKYCENRLFNRRRAEVLVCSTWAPPRGVVVEQRQSIHIYRASFTQYYNLKILCPHRQWLFPQRDGSPNILQHVDNHCVDCVLRYNDTPNDVPTLSPSLVLVPVFVRKWKNFPRNRFSCCTYMIHTYSPVFLKVPLWVLEASCYKIPTTCPHNST